MKWSELKDRPVVSVAGAERLGFVDDLFLDPDGRRVLGFCIRSGGLITRREAMTIDDAQAIGDDAVTVVDASKLNRRDSFSGLDGAREATSVIGSKVMTVSGQEVGRVGDIVLNEGSTAVLAYLLKEGIISHLRRKEHSVAVSEVTSLGEGLLVVSDSAVHEEA